MTNDKEISLRPELKSHDPNNLILIDGSGYIFRAFYGLPPMTNQDGVPVNAVFGFTKMLLKLIDDLKPIYAAVIFDVARKTFRNEIYEDYKGNRSDPPEDLIPQFSIIRNATEAIGLPVVEMEGFEADDLIATYASLAQDMKKKVIIISSDKDLMQLVDDNIILFDPMKQFWINEDKVFEKFGVYPNKVIDVQSLAGDSSDNIPGVPGIGVKTAAELINKYKNLDNLLKNIDEIPQNKRRETLLNNKDKAILSRKLVTLKDDVPVKDEPESFIMKEVEKDKLFEFLREMEFNRLLSQAISFYGESKTSSSKQSAKSDIKENQKINIKSYECIKDEKTLDKWIKILEEKEVIAVDTETDSLNPLEANLVGVSFSYAPNKACYIPLAHKEKSLRKEIVLKKIKGILEDPSIKKVGQNIKFDFIVLKQNGVNIDPIEDTMLLSYTLDAGLNRHNMDVLSEIHLGH